MPEKRQGPYPRPFIEIEYDQQALQAEGCCRFVPAVIRVCGVPEKVVMTNAHFERTRAVDGIHYDPHPISSQFYHYDKSKIPGYAEYHVVFLARSQEPGLFQFTMESAGYTRLTDVTFHFIAGQSEPVIHGEAKGVKAYRFIPFIRSEEERDALLGQYPAQVKGAAHRQLTSSSALSGAAPVIEGVEMPSLFERGEGG